MKLALISKYDCPVIFLQLYFLLVNNNQGWQQLNVETLKVKEAPNKVELRKLINDAIHINPKRYGEIISIDDLKIHYFQWTGINSINRVLGFVGLGLVVILAFLSLWMMI